MMIPVVIYMTKEFPLLEAFNEKLEILKSAGLISYWIANTIKKKSSDNRSYVGPRTLTLTDVGGYFKILFACFFGSFLVLVVEIIYDIAHRPLIKSAMRSKCTSSR